MGKGSGKRTADNDDLYRERHDEIFNKERKQKKTKNQMESENTKIIEKTDEGLAPPTSIVINMAGCRLDITDRKLIEDIKVIATEICSHPMPEETVND